jgi:hypothetical protein
VAVWRRNELPHAAQRALVFCVLVVGGGLLVQELEPLFYYNVRYLSYLLPFVMIGAFTVLLLPARRGRWLGHSALVTLLLLAGTTTSWRAFDQHRALVRSAVSNTFPDRFELRRTVGNAKVSSAIDSLGTRRYLAYIFRRPYASIPVVNAGDRISSGYVFATARRAPPGTIVWHESTDVLVKVPAGGTRIQGRASG